MGLTFDLVCNWIEKIAFSGSTLRKVFYFYFSESYINWEMEPHGAGTSAKVRVDLRIALCGRFSGRRFFFNRKILAAIKMQMLMPWFQLPTSLTCFNWVFVIMVGSTQGTGFQLGWWLVTWIRWGHSHVLITLQLWFWVYPIEVTQSFLLFECRWPRPT